MIPVTNAQAGQAAAKIIEQCRDIATITETPGCGTQRTFLSNAARECHGYVRGRMQEAGLETWIDAAGNLHGLRRNPSSLGRRLLAGSHLDTVPNAGAYDGILGVMAAIALVEATAELSLRSDIEVVAFSEEEGVRFGAPFIGSRALVGRLDEALLQLRDRAGVSVRDAIENFGLQVKDIPYAEIGSNILGFLELHIEQGPVLEDAGKHLGVVTAIAGQSRFVITFTGRAGHAGTTPMGLRCDALVGAAEWVVEVERVGAMTPGLVATVGALQVTPGASNVIAGKVTATLDVRHEFDSVRIAAVDGIIGAARDIAGRRGLRCETALKMDQPAVPMDTKFVSLLQEAADQCGTAAIRMISGAGHDAMILAERVPAAMLFVRSPGGISHHPDETVLVEDVAAALRTGTLFLEMLSATI